MEIGYIEFCVGDDLASWKGGVLLINGTLPLSSIVFVLKILQPRPDAKVDLPHWDYE